MCLAQLSRTRSSAPLRRITLRRTAATQSKKAAFVEYDWEDALRVEKSLLTEDELAIKYVKVLLSIHRREKLVYTTHARTSRQASHEYCQENLMPRVLEAHRKECQLETVFHSSARSHTELFLTSQLLILTF
jgi:glutaryl-CoA dehydrogenase